MFIVQQVTAMDVSDRDSVLHTFTRKRDTECKDLTNYIELYSYRILMNVLYTITTSWTCILD